MRKDEKGCKRKKKPPSGYLEGPKRKMLRKTKGVRGVC